MALRPSRLYRMVRRQIREIVVEPEFLQALRQERKWYEKPEHLIGLLGVAVSVVGFFLVWQQIHFMRKQNSVAAETSLFSQTVIGSQILLEHDNVRFTPFFYGLIDPRTGEREQVMPDAAMTHDQRLRLYLLAESVADLLDNVMSTRTVLDDDHAKSWSDYAEEACARSPCLREFILREQKSYSVPLVELVQRIERQSGNGRKSMRVYRIDANHASD